LHEALEMAKALITDEVIYNHAACGLPADVRARFDAYHAAGLDEIVIAGTRDGTQIATLLAALSKVDPTRCHRD
jgi:hypothetical protein